MNLKHFTSAECFGMTILDPVTILTNLLIFGAGIFCARRLGRVDEMHQLQWRWFFLLIGIAALLGVPVHGFSNYLGESTTLFLWLTMGLVQGLGATFAVLATLRRWSANYDRWRYVPVIQFALFTAAVLYFKNYEAVKIHLALSLLPVMAWNIILFFREEASGIWIASGFFVAAITALVHSFKLSINPWMNFNDIAHIMIVISLFLISNGNRKLVPEFVVETA